MSIQILKNHTALDLFHITHAVCSSLEFKVSAVRFTLNSLMMAHKLFTLENIELMGHHQRAFSTICVWRFMNEPFGMA